MFLLHTFAEFGWIIQFSNLNPLNFYWTFFSTHTPTLSSPTKKYKPNLSQSSPFHSQREGRLFYVEFSISKPLHLRRYKICVCGIDCGTSIFLAVTKVNCKVGFLHLCGPEKGIIWGLEKKTELALCSGSPSPWIFTDWMWVFSRRFCTLRRCLRSREKRLCQCGELKDTHRADCWLLSSVAKLFNFLN